MSINKFITNLDLARQAEIMSGETAVFQGGIELGIPFSGFPSGVDTSTIVSLGIVGAEFAAFSGNTGTTVFNVTDPSSPYYSVSATTLSASPYTIIDDNSITETVSATTYPTIMTFTALSGDCCSTPISVSFTPPIIQELYDRGLYDGLFDGLGQASIGTTYIDESFYNVGSVFSGANLNMEIVEYGVHGATPAWVTGTTSGTVVEYSALTQYWVDPIYENLTSGLTLPITPESADTQTSDYVWTLTDSTIIDENLVGLQYTGYSVTYSFNDVIIDPESPSITGGVTGATSADTYYLGTVTATLENYSAGTLDYKGSTNWLIVNGSATIDERLTTDRLTIHTLGTGSPVTMLAVDINGNVVGGTGGTTDDTGAFTSTTANNTIIPTNAAGNTNDSDYASILGGQNNTISVTSTSSSIVGGENNTLDDTDYSIISGGRLNTINATTSSRDYNGIFGGINNVITDCVSSFISSSSSSITGGANYGVILGGTANNMDGVDYGFILGGNGNTNNSQNYSGIIGGFDNTLEGSQSSSIILGGVNNDIGGFGSYNTIIGGYNNNISGTTNVVSNSIIGGNGNTIEGDLDNIIILGGVGVTATQEDTTYVDNLNINTLGGGASVNNLGIDASGNVVSGSTGGGTSYWSAGTGTNAIVMNNGGNTSSGTLSTAQGFGTTASGDYAHAEGDRTDATGIASHAEGLFSNASGDYAHAEGNNTDATGISSHAEGQLSLASGNYSHAEGLQTDSTNNGSHSEGTYSLASGVASHAQNRYTIASGNYSHASGYGHDSNDRVVASGETSFTHQYVSDSSGYLGVYGNNSSILGGIDNNIDSSSQSSFIGGGENNRIVGANRSVVLGGQNITGTTDDTVYMNNLYITQANGGNYYSDMDNSSGPTVVLSGSSSDLTRLTVTEGSGSSFGLGIRGATEVSFPGYGKQGDAYIYSTIGNNGINIISAAGSGTDDYIRFYAGGDASTLTNSDLMIVGSGLTRGYVGIGTDTPTEKLDIDGNLKVSGEITASGIPSYADDAAAGVGGLSTGEVYQTDGTGASPLNVAGILMIKQ